MIFNILFILALVASVWCAVQISVADFRRRIIPDAYLFPLMIMGLFVVVFSDWIIDVRSAVIGAAFGYGLAAFVGATFDYIRRRHNSDADIPIGMGDIKLMGVGGIWLGVNGMAITLVIACITGVLWGYFRKQKFIPFAPFFLFGGFLSLIIMKFLIL